MKKKILIIGICVIVVALFFLIPFIKEYNFYKKFMESDSWVTSRSYLEEYPDGRYVKEATQRLEELSYQDVKKLRTETSCTYYDENCPDGKHKEEVAYIRIGCSSDPWRDINAYIEKYPKGEFMDSVRVEYEKVWDKEIAKYNNNKGKLSASARKFMDEMMDYMKYNMVNTICVEVNSTLRLKDYKEYPQEVRALLEMLNDNSLNIEENMIPLKEKFPESYTQSLNSLLIDGLQQSFDAVFKKGFVNVVTTKNEKAPQVKINYVIQSQEDKLGATPIPHIWEYTESSIYGALPGSKSVKAYLIGISINFNAHYTIPGSQNKYDFAGVGKPENDISNIEDISDGYQKMTKTCFEQFSDNLSKSLGLQKTEQENQSVDELVAPSAPLYDLE